VKITAVIQARMGSTRLPGKILMKINGIAVLQCQLQQLDHSSMLDDIILATTTNPEDDVIVDFAHENSIKVFRGSSLDVLDRYYQCSQHFSLEHIVRITSDCPLIDPTIVDKTIELYKSGKFDYVNNFGGIAYPSGTDVEVFSINTLTKAWVNATKSSEREHVTAYMYNNPKLFSIGYVENNLDILGLHYSVDRIEDLQFVKALYKKIPNRPILLSNIVKSIKDDLTLLNINKNTNPKEGYLKSLENDEASFDKTK
jgi:spore coat polysaccharide biosynthesis protein SpsF